MTAGDLTIIISLLTFGLFGSFTHCAGMCGPFVLTQVTNKLSNVKISQANNFTKLSGLLLLPYHLGRITTYCFIGTLSSILASILENITNFKIVSGLLLMLAAIIMINSTLIKIKLPFKNKLIEILPSFSFGLANNSISKKIKNTINYLFLSFTASRNAVFKNYLLGVLLGFIPCGLLYAAIAAVASLDNHLVAFLAMLCFGIATIPSLFLTACGGYWFFDRIKNNLAIFTKIILSVNALTLFIMAIGLIFNKI
jgi:hypothetical protein